MRSADWNPYFIQRAPAQGKDFEEDYWGSAVDPDGNTRIPTEERERRLEDVQEELKHINSLSPGRILDVGCGLGYLLSGVDDAWEKHGVELSRFAAARARTEGQIHIGDLKSAAYPSAYFDVVVLYHVIEHMHAPAAEIKELYRVLKPGGCLIVGTPNFDSACARRFGERFRLLNDQTHVSLFSEESLNRLLWDHGFFVERTEFPYFETRHFTSENFERLKNTDAVSPPFYGNIMTVYCKKPVRSEAMEVFAIASRIAHRVAIEQSDEIDAIKEMLDQYAAYGGRIWFVGDLSFDHALRLEAAGYKTASCADPDNLPPGITPQDLLFLVALEDVPNALLAAAKARGIRAVAMVAEDCEEPDADIVIDIPSADRRVVEFVQSSVCAAICLAPENALDSVVPTIETEAAQ